MKELNMSFKPEVQTDTTGIWYGNDLRFATHKEAEANAVHLGQRWLLVLDTRAVESPDPVNYQFIDGDLRAIMRN